MKIGALIVNTFKSSELFLSEAFSRVKNVRDGTFGPKNWSTKKAPLSRRLFDLSNYKLDTKNEQNPFKNSLCKEIDVGGG